MSEGFTNPFILRSQTSRNFAGLKEKIPYLKELGINAVELMPIFEFDEMINAREVDGKQLVEYWGYNTVGFFHQMPVIQLLRKSIMKDRN